MVNCKKTVQDRVDYGWIFTPTFTVAATTGNHHDSESESKFASECCWGKLVAGKHLGKTRHTHKPYADKQKLNFNWY